MQLEIHNEDGRSYVCNIPDADDEVLPGIEWGHAGTPYTPAYWKFKCISTGALDDFKCYRLGNSLTEEVIACLLGGYGIKGELGLAAFRHLLANRVTKHYRSAGSIESLLSEPLNVNGKLHRYRYPRQKAKYISAAIDFLQNHEPPKSCNIKFRNWLLEVPGIGYKTASWVTRNWLDAPDVAILDIHIHRAGVISGIFQSNDDVSKEYLRMEAEFTKFADAIRIPANILDNQIWNELRKTPAITRKMLMERGVVMTDRCGLPGSYNRRSSRNYELFATA